jgi:hypothetical protein
MSKQQSSLYNIPSSESFRLIGNIILIPLYRVFPYLEDELCDVWLWQPVR